MGVLHDVDRRQAVDLEWFVLAVEEQKIDAVVRHHPEFPRSDIHGAAE